MLCLLFLLLRAVIKMGNCKSKSEKRRNIEVLAIAWWNNRLLQIGVDGGSIPAKNTQTEINLFVVCYLRNIRNLKKKNRLSIISRLM